MGQLWVLKRYTSTICAREMGYIAKSHLIKSVHILQKHRLKFLSLSRSTAAYSLLCYLDVKITIPCQESYRSCRQPMPWTFLSRKVSFYFVVSLYFRHCLLHFVRILYQYVLPRSTPRVAPSVYRGVEQEISRCRAYLEEIHFQVSLPTRYVT